MATFEIVKYTPDEDEGLIKIGPFSSAWRSYVIRARIGDHGVTLGVETEDNGRPRCRWVEVDGSNVTSDVLRRVPVGRLISESRRSPLIVFDQDFTSDLSADAPVDVYGVGKRQPTKGRPLEDDHLHAVAATYRAAAAVGDRPTAEVARIAGVGTRTASRWVRAARDRGLLGDALPGRGGEA